MGLSQNDLIREWINAQIADGADFTLKSVRKESMEKFLLANPKLKRKSVSAAWGKILGQIAKERGIPQEKVKTASKTKRQFNPNMNAEIKPDPVDIRTGPGIQTGQNWQDGQQQQQGQQQYQYQQQQQGQQIHWGPQQEKRYSAKAISAFFNGLYMGLRIAVPEMEELTDAERETLGEIWVDELNFLLQGHERAGTLMAIGATIGLMAQKVVEGLKKRKAEKKKQGQAAEVKKAAQEAAKDIPKDQEKEKESDKESEKEKEKEAKPAEPAPTQAPDADREPGTEEGPHE